MLSSFLLVVFFCNMTFFKHDELCLRCFAAKELGDKFGITLSKDLFRELLSVSNNNTSVRYFYGDFYFAKHAKRLF